MYAIAFIGLRTNEDDEQTRIELQKRLSAALSEVSIRSTLRVLLQRLFYTAGSAGVFKTLCAAPVIS